MYGGKLLPNQASYKEWSPDRTWLCKQWTLSEGKEEVTPAVPGRGPLSICSTHSEEQYWHVLLSRGKLACSSKHKAVVLLLTICRDWKLYIKIARRTESQGRKADWQTMRNLPQHYLRVLRTKWSISELLEKIALPNVTGGNTKALSFSDQMWQYVSSLLNQGQVGTI